MAKYAQYYDYITGTGVIVPDTNTILSDVQEEWRDVFGQNLSVEPETPQGRIIEMIARQRVFTVQMAAALSNVLNINKAYGFVLDDLGSLFQLQRKSATTTKAIITMMGVDGTVVPAGTQLKSDNGDIFINPDPYTIGGQIIDGQYQTPGSTTGLFESQESGEILAPANSITTIVSSVSGLESVTNNSPAEVGVEQESDQEFRNRIKASLNVNSMSVLSAIKSSVANITGVKQVAAYENTSSTDFILNDTFAIPAHGFGIIVDYSESNPETQKTANDIAEAIYKKKTLGAAQIHAKDGDADIYQTTGDSLSDLTVNTTTFDTAVNGVWGVYRFIYDGSDWYISGAIADLTDYGITFTGTPEENDVITVNYPAGQKYIITIDYPDENDGQGHNITFATPISVDVKTSIIVQKRNYAGDDLESDIKTAIANFMNGDNPEVDRVGIGETLSPFEISAAISSEIPDIFIESITIGRVGSAESTAPIQLGEAEKLVIQPDNITVTIR